MDYSLLTKRLGEQIRYRRLSRGMTQAKLAALAGITRQKVIAIERGDLTGDDGLRLQKHERLRPSGFAVCRCPLIYITPMAGRIH
ncbi:helix-turn-helix domain-containing protein [Pseudomonas aeruginosa]|nr:helix-turn-helix domain-containing protein [Pseudomonas aeruginosa]